MTCQCISQNPEGNRPNNALPSNGCRLSSVSGPEGVKRDGRDALPKGGAVIVYDAIIDDDRRENAFGLLMSLNMLIETAGGFEYAGEDCQG
jgi:hypothetical protein